MTRQGGRRADSCYGEIGHRHLAGWGAGDKSWPVVGQRRVGAHTLRPIWLTFKADAEYGLEYGQALQLAKNIAISMLPISLLLPGLSFARPGQDRFNRRSRSCDATMRAVDAAGR